MHFWHSPIDSQQRFCLFQLQDAYAEPGQDSRNIAGIDIVIIVEDVQDVAPVFMLAPPVTRLPSGLIPGDKVMRTRANKSFRFPAERTLVISTFNKLSNSRFRFFKFTLRMAIKAFRGKFDTAWCLRAILSLPSSTSTTRPVSDSNQSFTAFPELRGAQDHSSLGNKILNRG